MLLKLRSHDQSKDSCHPPFLKNLRIEFDFKTSFSMKV